MLDTACVILAGGQSERFGSPKGLAKIGAKNLIQLIMDILRTQTRGTIALNTAETSVYAQYAETIIADQAPSLGPLSGLHAALKWGNEMGFSEIATTPLDTPFLPDDFLIRLQKSVAPAVAQSNDHIHFMSGLWSTDLAPSLEAFINSGERSGKRWVNHCDARSCPFDSPDGDPFFNINTPDDLDLARKLYIARSIS